MIVENLVGRYIVIARFLQQSRSIQFFGFTETRSILVVHDGENCFEAKQNF